MAEQDPTILLKAILSLMVDERESRLNEERGPRTEVLLAGAGLSAVEIAELTGRNAAAVRMALSRARRSGSAKGNPRG
jgi:DNA-directed RNA polymerase specialized sigma24 family protein